jgi:hypothetical protein
VEILKSRGFDYIALAKDDVGILSVVCGTSAFFEVRLTMPRPQLAALLADVDELARLLDAVRLAPQRYAA